MNDAYIHKNLRRPVIIRKLGGIKIVRHNRKGEERKVEKKKEWNKKKRKRKKKVMNRVYKVH